MELWSSFLFIFNRPNYSCVYIQCEEYTYIYFITSYCFHRIGKKKTWDHYTMTQWFGMPVSYPLNIYLFYRWAYGRGYMLCIFDYLLGESAVKFGHIFNKYSGFQASKLWNHYKPKVLLDFSIQPLHITTQLLLHTNPL